MKKNILFFALLIFSASLASLTAQEKTLYFISNSHLDTQWNWDVKTTINEYIPNTMKQNFALLNKYDKFQFNFEAAIHYMWMKEYYPNEYETLKQHIQNGRWHISGGSINANDVMVPSAESIIRNFLYGQTYYKKEFGRKGGSDIMLPDCFGFPYSLPTLGKHCGVTGFHTAKLAWGSAYDYNSLAPFGIWKGVDGSEIYAIFKGEAYDQHEAYNKDMSNDSDIHNIINNHNIQYGVPFAFRYVGPRSDRGGALKDEPGTAGENTPYWLQTSVNANGPVKVKLATPDEIFSALDQYRNNNYFVWDNELPMSTHGTGCYTSQTMMKYWNRKNELLADATEKSSVFADWLGSLHYQSDIIRDSWVRLLWHQFHDDLTGTSIPNAYIYSHNDEVLVNRNLSSVLLNTVGAVAKHMNTQVEGIPLVVYNPLSIRRTEVVEASVTVESAPGSIRVLNNEGNEVLAQITEYNESERKLSFIFEAIVPSLGYTVYELRLNENSTLQTDLKVENRNIQNDLYSVALTSNGDAIVFDKQTGAPLTDAIRLAMFNDISTGFPSWEIIWNTLSSPPFAYVDENVNISIAENGPLRVSLKITRSKEGSEFVQYIRMVPSRINKRIDFVNEVNWQTRQALLKAVFPLKATNPKATYDLSIGAIERGINASNLYEVAGHQWADQTHTNGEYGISILNDCKYGWDKPGNNMLRLTLIHSPAVGNSYTYQKDQDLGLNRFTFSFYRHTGQWNESTQWEAASLNQPLLAFVAPKHDGALGKLVNVVSLNTDKVAVKALKKAEESNEIIVRVYELTGNEQRDVKMIFPAAIVSAREVNGIEETVGTASSEGNEMTFNIGRFQPKTFAVTLADNSGITAKNPVSAKVDLNYNVDVMSYDSKKFDVSGTYAMKHAYPAELLADSIVSDGIVFKTGSRANGAKNAVYCSGQTITLPTTSDAKKLYLLAASKNENGSVAEFNIGDKSYSFSIPYYTGNIGTWESEYNLGSEFRNENVAFTATHRHNVSNSNNEFYNFMYMYKYCIPLTGNETTLKLPNDNNVYVFAITLSDNENDDVQTATALTSIPEYKDLSPNTGGCSQRLIPVSVRASHQNGTNEGAGKAIDMDITSKWCVTNNNTPWLELTFNEPVEICHWFVMNAGNEEYRYITKDFALQYLNGTTWQNADVVTNNTINKVNRSVTPFTTNKVRLQINQGEQNGNTTRILEFAVYGEDKTTSIKTPLIAENGLFIIGNYPNPVTDKTIIQCTVPENIDKLTLQVFNLAGNLISTNNYKVDTRGIIQNMEWNAQSESNGIYLYKVQAFEGNKLHHSATNKMVVAR